MPGRDFGFPTPDRIHDSTPLRQPEVKTEKEHPFSAQLLKAIGESNRLIADKGMLERRIAELPPGVRLDMEMDAVYAEKFEEARKLALEEMQQLEQQLNANPDIRDRILAKIVEEREHAIDMDKEARARRKEMLSKFDGISA